MSVNGKNGSVAMRPLPKKKLCLVYPHDGSVRQVFMDSVMAFREFDGVHNQVLGSIIHARGMYVEEQRNELVTRFLKTDLEWFLTIDTDHKFAPEIPYLLIQSAEDNDARVMSALYFGI